jgi:hypothetical protein
MEEGELGPRVDDHQPVGLGDLRGDLGEVFRAGDADGDGKGQLVAHASADRRGDLGRRAEEVRATCDVGDASSIEIRSTSGVKSPRTLMAASPSRWYSLKCPPTKTRSGHSSRARRPGMPPWTPKAFAS